MELVAGKAQSDTESDVQTSDLHHDASPATDSTLDFRGLLAARDRVNLIHMLQTDFKNVATGEWAWLVELAGLYDGNHEEIADILLEREEQSPWIYVKSPNTKHRLPDPRTHVPRCPHVGAFGQCVTAKSGIAVATPTIDSEGIRKTVASLCGLAGVLPNHPERSKWNGAVEFENELKATVCYNFDNASPQTLLDRVANAMAGLCTALGTCQEAGLCCERFTILCNEPGKPFVEIRLLAFEDVVRLHQALGAARLDDIHSLEGCTEAAINILRCLKLCDATSQIAQAKTAHMSNKLHICALAAQSLCLAFAMYCQGHCGPFAPFFLEHSLTSFDLTGTATTADNKPYVRARLDRLTFLDFPVLIFCTPSRAEHLRKPYELLATGREIVETWAPCKLLTNTRDGIPDQLVGMELCGGMIFALDDNYYWAEFQDLPTLEPKAGWDLSTRMLVKRYSPTELSTDAQT